MRRSRKLALALLAAALGIGAILFIRGKGPNARTVVSSAAARRFDAAASDVYYRRHATSTLSAFLDKYDSSSDGRIELVEVEHAVAAEIAQDVAAIFNAAEKLKALDAFADPVAKRQLEERSKKQLELIASEDHALARRAYWDMDMQSRYLARRLRLIPETTLEFIDGGGRRRINGAEDIPAIMSFSKETVREYEVPWPPGNVAVAASPASATARGVMLHGEKIRVFLTPFPDGNFSSAQVHELDLETGSVTPYLPSAEFQSRVMNALGIEAHRGILYIVDHGFYGVHDARLIAIDLAKDEVILDYPFAIELGQMPNDLVFIDDDGVTKLFISDTAPGRSPLGLFNADSAIIEIDLAVTGGKLSVARLIRHLDGDPIVEDGGFSLYPDRDAPAKTWLGELGWGGVDGIAQYDGRIYFKRMLDPAVRAAPFRDIRAQTSPVVDELPFMDGFRIDERGNLFFGDVENSALFAYSIATGILFKIIEDSRFHWIDEVNVHGDTAYVTCSHLHEFMYEASTGAKKRAVDAARPFYFFVVDLRPAYAVIDRLLNEK